MSSTCALVGRKGYVSLAVDEVEDRGHDGLHLSTGPQEAVSNEARHQAQDLVTENHQVKKHAPQLGDFFFYFFFLLLNSLVCTFPWSFTLVGITEACGLSVIMINICLYTLKYILLNIYFRKMDAAVSLFAKWLGLSTSRWVGIGPGSWVSSSGG